MAEHKFLTEFLYKLAQMMDPSMMGGAPPMPPPPPGMPPVDPSMMGGAPPPMDPSMMGGAPPMDPSMMGGAPPAGGLDPNMLAALLQQGPALEGGGDEGQVTDKEIADKALGVAEAAMQLALAKGDEQGATDAAAGAMLGSGALEGISPEEILALNQEAEPQEMEGPPPIA